MSKFLGIDTSNYTTSVAVFDSADMSVRQGKKLLPVKAGERGIRQSDAVFHHTKQLPSVIEKVIPSGYIPGGIGVSVKPRMIDGSYMPCFLVGESAADCIGSVCGIEVDKTSHQVGHILAALYSANRLDLIRCDKPFIAFHVSGGTTDVLLCKGDKDNVLKIDEIGGSSDLKAGQVIDRIGVRLGLDFPCGKKLEELSINHTQLYKVKTSMNGLYCSLSGIENQCIKLMEQGSSAEDIAFFCLQSVFNAIHKLSQAAINEVGNLPIVFAGGVMSNLAFREKLLADFNGYFAQPEFSCDNAVGVAIYSAIRKGLV